MHQAMPYLLQRDGRILSLCFSHVSDAMTLSLSLSHRRSGRQLTATYEKRAREGGREAGVRRGGRGGVGEVGRERRWGRGSGGKSTLAWVSAAISLNPRN